MAKWFGTVGFRETSETKPGVYTPTITERQYYGDMTRNIHRLSSSDKVNDDIDINNQLSIVADPYAVQNFSRILYASFMGTNWKVSSVEVQYPRLVLSLGGVYSGKTA